MTTKSKQHWWEKAFNSTSEIKPVSTSSAAVREATPTPPYRLPSGGATAVTTISTVPLGIFKQPDKISQYSEDCTKRWNALRQEHGSKTQATENFVARTYKYSDCPTLPLYENLGWWVPIEHHPGFYSLFVFFTTEFTMDYEKTLEEVSRQLDSSHEAIAAWLSQFSKYIHIPNRFFYGNDSESFRPQALYLYARYLYKRYPAQLFEDPPK